MATSLANAIGHGMNWGTTELGTALWSEYHSKALTGEVKAISENKLFKIFN